MKAIKLVFHLYSKINWNYVTFLSETEENFRRQSYKRNLVFKKINLVLNFVVVRYLNSDCNNTVVRSKLR